MGVGGIQHLRIHGGEGQCPSLSLDMKAEKLSLVMLVTLASLATRELA